MKTMKEGGRIPCACLLMAVLSAAVFLVPGLNALLEYDRGALPGWELWRLLSCHFTHFTADVLLWDILAFVVLGAICEQRSRGRFLACVIASALLIPAALYVFAPSLTVYRGLSGIDSALFGLLAVILLRESIRSREPGRIALVVLFVVLFLAKTCCEAAFGSTVFVSNGGQSVVPVPLAHAVGAAVGVLVALLPGCGRGAAGSPKEARAGASGNAEGTRALNPAWCRRSRSAVQ